MAKVLARLGLPTWLSGRTRVAPRLSDRELADAFRDALFAVLGGDYATAERHIEAAVRAGSDDVGPYRALARLYRLRGEIGRAITLHQNLLLRRGLDERTRAAVLSELARDFRQGGFVKRALAAYQDVLAHDPNDADALRASSELSAEAGDYERALETRRRLAKVERRSDPVAEARLLARIAEVEHGSGRHDAARKLAKKALRRDPKSADARILLGRLAAERGRSRAAMAAWRGVAEEGGRAAARVYPLVEASYAALGRPREYEPFVRSLLEKRPGDAVARRALASALAARGETDAAARELRRVIELDPEDAESRIALGRLLLAERRDAEALDALRELLAWLDRRKATIGVRAELGEPFPVEPAADAAAGPKEPA